MAARKEIENYLNTLLAVERFEDYGPNGLQVEGRDDVQRIVSGVTASLALIDAAITDGADAIVVHHGLFWRGQDGRLVGWLGERVRRLMTHRINLFAYHLPLDAHPELGNNAQLGLRLGLAADARFGAQALGFAAPAGANTSLAVLAARVQSALGGRAPLVLPGDGRALARIGWCTGGAQGYRGRNRRRRGCLPDRRGVGAAGPPGARNRCRLPGLRPPRQRVLRRAGAGRASGRAIRPRAPLHRDREPGVIDSPKTPAVSR